MLGTFIFNSCSRHHTIKHECIRSKALRFSFIVKDSLYLEKYSLKDIKISMNENINGVDSIINPIINDSEIFNHNFYFDLDNDACFYTTVEFDIYGKIFIFSEFEIKKVRTETMFGGYYESCDIVSCKVNGVKKDDWYANIKTGL